MFKINHCTKKQAHKFIEEQEPTEEQIECIKRFPTDEPLENFDPEMVGEAFQIAIAMNSGDTYIDLLPIHHMMEVIGRKRAAENLYILGQRIDHITESSLHETIQTFPPVIMGIVEGYQVRKAMTALKHILSI